MATPCSGGLSVHRERMYIRLAQTGSGQESRAALNRLVIAFRPLIFSEANSLVRRFDGFPEQVALRDDLVQEGLMAFLEAVERFDLSRSTRLSTFVVPTVRGYMLNYIRTEKQQRRHIPLADAPRLRDQDAVEHELLVPASGQPAQRLQRSLDRPVHVRRVNEALHTLTDREREVVKLRYWHDMRQVAIADRLGISRARVSVLLSSAHERLEPLLQGTWV